MLKVLIKKLHDGAELESVKKEFIKHFGSVSPSEIAEIEQSLIDEGLPKEEVKRLCDVHVQVFKHSLDEQKKPQPPAGHPVHNFMVENRATENILQEIEKILERTKQPTENDLKKYKDELVNLIDKLSEIDKHYLRKENQLFPMLEEKGMSGPSQVMWAIHDDIRQMIKKAPNQVSESDVTVFDNLSELIQKIRDMIYKEENILFPMSLEALTLQDWLKVQKGEEEIGFSWIEPLVEWKPDIKIEDDKVSPELIKTLKLDVGNLSAEQVNLVLKHVPFDITFVDENDKVAYYSQGKERLFPRSPGIIGRSVQRCHPPKSVHIVEKIVGEFKSGKRDIAEFWINVGDKLVYIRYFAVRDDQNRYKGTLEVSQDVTDIKLLEGEKRLLDWKD